MIKNIFAIFNIALVTALIFLGVKLGYHLLSAKLTEISEPDLAAFLDTGPGADRDRTSRPPAAVYKKIAYKAITDRDLFKTGEAAKPENTADAIELDNLEETRLQLKLFGTITGSDEQDYAVIEDTQKRKQGLYRNGDAIQNAEVKMILRKKVVLTVNGKDEILLMEDEKEGAARRPSPSNAPFDEPEMEDRFGDGETVSIDRDEINDSLRNINQLMSQVKVRPHFRDGKPDGLLLSHVQQNSIFKEMGLQNGDIVKGVNGKEIQSVDDALKFYDNLKSSSSVELQIERQGQQQSINYQIE